MGMFFYYIKNILKRVAVVVIDGVKMLGVD